VRARKEGVVELVVEGSSDCEVSSFGGSSCCWPVRGCPVLALAKDLCLTPTQNSQEITTNTELAGRARLCCTTDVIDAEMQKTNLQLTFARELIL
jgi:predicted metal-binding transcription factor (methanogenesis marker protein 9)